MIDNSIRHYMGYFGNSLYNNPTTLNARLRNFQTYKWNKKYLRAAKKSIFRISWSYFRIGLKIAIPVTLAFDTLIIFD